MSDWDSLELESLEKHIKDWSLKGLPQERVGMRSLAFPTEIITIAHAIHIYCEVTKVDRGGNSYVTQPNMTEVWHGMMSCGIHHLRQWEEYKRWQTVNRAIIARRSGVPASLSMGTRTPNTGYMSVSRVSMSLSRELAGEISDIAWNMHLTQSGVIAILAIISVSESEAWVDQFSTDYISFANKSLRILREGLGEEARQFDLSR